MAGNLWSVTLAEAEREKRVEELLHLKKINDLVKLKRQAELYGVDWSEFLDTAGVEPPSGAP